MDIGYIASILHDVIEDEPKNTEINRKKIEREIKLLFGNDMLVLVLAVSNIDNIDNIEYGKGLLNYKNKYLHTQKEYGAFKIKMCDLLDNVGSLNHIKDINEKNKLKHKYSLLLKKYKYEFGDVNKKIYNKLVEMLNI